MPFKFQRIYPICGKEELTNISRNLSLVHGLKSFARKPWLKLAKYQTMNTVYKHLASKTREQTKYSYPVKRIKNMKKQKIPTKPSVVNEFLYTKMMYPNFKFQHPMSIFVVGPTNSGKTYFVDQLLSNLKGKMQFSIEQKRGNMCYRGIQTTTCTTLKCYP